MTIAPGTRLGSYEVVAPIGAGGMGEVYRARDTKLGRDVAIKVLPANFVNDPERLSRFQREARMLAALNHANIATIYGLEQCDGVTCLVMELVPGETLAERVKAGPLGIEEALKIAVQIAEALEAAHEKSIIHRDLKPANVKVTPEGKVKVLDFGLAKAFAGDAANEDLSNSPTLSMAATMQGVILGTAAYMSPEQAKGKPVTKATDIWAFGCVLYELLSGRAAFEGEDVTEILAAVVRAEPEWNALPEKTPQGIRLLLRRCLRKDRRQRFQDATDVRIEIEDVVTGVSPSEAAQVASRQQFPLVWITLCGVLLVALAALSFVHFREAPAQQPITRFQVPPPEQSVISMFKVSPNGRYVVIRTLSEGRNRLWVRPLDSLQWQALQNTEDATYPFWSPDGANIGFFAQGKLKKIAVTGGPPQTLCDAPEARGGAWSVAGVVLFAPNIGGGLYEVSADGGVPEPATKITTTGPTDSHRYPEFLPDGRYFLYLQQTDRKETGGIYAGSLDGAQPIRLLADQSNAVYVASAGPRNGGYLLFRREGTLMAQPFDPDRLRLEGDVFPVAEQVGISGNIGQGAFSASRNGVLAYRIGGPVAKREFDWTDRAGKRLDIVTSPGLEAGGALSRDEKRLAFVIVNESGDLSDLWLQDLERKLVSRFTFEPGASFTPIWSPDGAHIAFALNNGGAQHYIIYQKALTGTGKSEILHNAGVNASTWDWSPDGKFILYSDYEEKTKYDLWTLPLEGDRKPIPYLQTPFNETHGQYSPNGRWVAYASDESGRFEVYVQSIPASGPKWQISNGGGDFPRWGRDGKELYYISADQKLMEMPVKTASDPSGGFEPGAPQPLFRIEPLNTSPTAAIPYQPAANGQKFLVNVQSGGEGTQAPPITVVLNWTAGLKK
jgi:serine/threonine protein kinase/Tol biopolymer transport system component